MDAPWIEWKGGKPPVHGNVRVTVLLRDGRVIEKMCVSWKPMWTHETEKTDSHIIAYYRTAS